MIICSHCGRENEDNYKFCLGCGSPLSRPEPPKPVVEAEPEPPKPLSCSTCGATIPDGFKFCGACGTPVTSTAPTPAPASQPRPVESAPLRVTQPRQENVNVTNPSGAPIMPSGAGLDSAPSTGSTVARLVVIRPDGSEGATIPLREGEVIVGRNSEHTVLANDPFLDPNHARIICQNGQFSIEDMSSLNGVFFRLKSEYDLESGDYIRLGQELLQFHRMSDVPAIQSENSEPDTLRGGSPDVGYWGRLSLISGPNLVSRSFAFSDDEVNIGREIGDIVFRDDGFVSGRHARLTKVDNRIVLKDLGSSNGTYIRIKKTIPLSDGDLILMGQQLFRLVG